MKSIRSKQMTAVLALLLGMSIAPLSYAQYIWLNEKGVKQFSDMPPPASVPKKNILKAPAGVERAPSSTSSTEESTAAAPAPDNAKAKDRGSMTAAELEADYKKRKKEQADKDKKAADEQQAAADKAKNCERAREYARTMESGQRVSKRNKDGERVFLTDEQRAHEAQEANSKLAACK